MQSGPEQSIARLVRRSEPLTARTALPSFREEGREPPLWIFSEGNLARQVRKPPLSPPFNPHSSMSDSSLGASWVFSFQPGAATCLTTSVSSPG